MKIRNPYFPSIPNTWEQSQTFTQQAVFQNPQTYWEYADNYFHFPQNSSLSFEFGGIGQIVFGYSASSARLQVVNYANGTSYPISVGAKPASFAPAIASGTVYQNTTSSYQTLRIAAYAATAGTAGSVAVALGTSSTPSTIETDYVSGGSSSTVTVPIVLRVPPQWYYSLTVSGAVLGSATGIQE